MRICIILPELVTYGGGQKFVSEVSRIWEKKHDVKIHTLFWNKKNWDLENVCAWKEREKMDSAFNLYSPFLIKKLEKQATGDVYNTHIFPSNWFGKKPNVWYAHDPPRLLYDLNKEVMHEANWAQKPLLAAYLPLLREMDLRETLKNVDCFIGNSKYCAKYLEEVYGKKAQVVYPGVDYKKFRYSKPERQNFLVVARLHSAKRVDLCIRAMAIIRKRFPHARLRVAGEGPERKKLEELVRALKIEQSVSFLGTLTEQQLVKEYENAYAVFYLPVREPFGIVPLEAGAAGKPVIAVKEGGCMETVIDGKTGFFVEPTENNVADRAVRLLGDRALAARLGREGRKRAKQFSWKKTAEGLLTILKAQALE